MKVWMDVCKYYGTSIHNVAEKYRELAPSNVEWVKDFMDADLCIDHLIGTPDRKNLVHPGERSFSEEVKFRLELAEQGQFKVAYVMHCAIVGDDFYEQAMNQCVISTGFLDIDQYLYDDYMGDSYSDRKYIRVAWGVDSWDFLLPMRTKDPEFLIYTWGASADPEEEFIETIYKACVKAKGKMLHSGADYKFDSGKHYVYLPPAKTKAEVAQRYNSAYFANAMRAEDGFELANLEAPLANARPITLNFGSYKYFFEDGGVSLLVGPTIRSDIQLEDEIVDLFKRKKELVVTQNMKNFVLENYSWIDTCGRFWRSVCPYQ